jgi:CheY-like chemotaxis protein
MDNEPEETVEPESIDTESVNDVAAADPAVIENDGEAKPPPEVMVLLAEDDVDLRELFTMTLENAGVGVVAVGSGAAALEALEARQFDLLVTDMWMPQVSGLDLCRKLRADPATKSLPILMMSAYGRMRGREEAMMVGATEYVTKPIRPSQFMSRVDTLLGGRLVAK